jgi:hypothetical protein
VKANTIGIHTLVDYSVGLKDHQQTRGPARLAREVMALDGEWVGAAAWAD